MAAFKTNPVLLSDLLRQCHEGDLQLPDFQRSWVWDDERIQSLIASVSQAFPVGALMTLETGGAVEFKPRAIQGAPSSAHEAKPTALLLDGQQRMTSLYQTIMRKEVVRTVTIRKKKVDRWYYIDMRKALDPEIPREAAILGIPADRRVRTDFGKHVDLDLSTPDLEYENMMFPVTSVLDWDAWQDGFGDYWIERGDNEKRKLFRAFKDAVLQPFKEYHVPVIELDRSTSREAVCLVFEKVNTGGKPLDAFELVTAIYAASGFELRKDWMGDDGAGGRVGRLRKLPVLDNIASTEFLQAISLLHTKDVRIEAERRGITGRDLPAVSATRASLLALPLDAYQRYADRVEDAFVRAARFLHTLRIYRAWDLPYQSQLVPLAAILAELGDRWDHEGPRKKVAEWYWCGVFGELYGSATETRFARDLVDVAAWVDGGPEPLTVTDATIRADRLLSMRTRLSAAYKGVNALLMRAGALDFRSGQAFSDTVFFDEDVDIHHIFPQDWCKRQGIPPSLFNSIINKTPLTSRTNRILGGAAPSAYLARLEAGGQDAPPIPGSRLDGYLASHLVDPALLRADAFHDFMATRQEALLALIVEATGRAAYRGAETNEPEEDAEDIG